MTHAYYCCLLATAATAYLTPAHLLMIDYIILYLSIYRRHGRRRYVTATRHNLDKQLTCGCKPHTSHNPLYMYILQYPTGIMPTLATYWRPMLVLRHFRSPTAEYSSVAHTMTYHKAAVTNPRVPAAAPDVWPLQQ